MYAFSKIYHRKFYRKIYPTENPKIYCLPLTKQLAPGLRESLKNSLIAEFNFTFPPSILNCVNNSP